MLFDIRVKGTGGPFLESHDFGLENYFTRPMLLNEESILIDLKAILLKVLPFYAARWEIVLKFGTNVLKKRSKKSA